MTAVTAELDAVRDLIPARVRRSIYATLVLASAGLTAALVGFETAGASVPTWLPVSLAVIGSLMTPVGLMAATNTPRDLDYAGSDAEPLILPAGDDPAIPDDEA